MIDVEHPLSRVRAMLDRLERSLQIPGDTGTSGARPWWNILVTDAAILST